MRNWTHAWPQLEHFFPKWEPFFPVFEKEQRRPPPPPPARCWAQKKEAVCSDRYQVPTIIDETEKDANQVQFTYANMYENIKVMLKSPVQRRYVLQIHTKNDIANILSWLDCEYGRFGEIYLSDGKWWL